MRKKSGRFGKYGELKRKERLDKVKNEQHNHKKFTSRKAFSGYGKK